jgi:Skp family chaperone for outer membrane proteins
MPAQHRFLGIALAICTGIASMFAVPTVAFAQASGFSLPDVPVLTIEPDRLFSDTLFGQRLSKEIAARGSQLAAENRRIEQELADEEGALTDVRDTMTPDEFRLLADEFYIKVTAARTEQDEKARVLTQTSDLAQRRFLVAIAAVMQQLMSEKGASVILDRRAVFVSADASDITREAIARIDSNLGEGTALDDLLPEPVVSPEQ